MIKSPTVFRNTHVHNSRILVCDAPKQPRLTPPRHVMPRYLPSLTYSSHYLRDQKFRDAVRAAMNEEQNQILYTTAMLTIQESPFKVDPSEHLKKQGIVIASDA